MILSIVFLLRRILERLHFLAEWCVFNRSNRFLLWAGLYLRGLKLPHILDSVGTCKETQIVISLLAYALQNDLNLVCIADHIDSFGFAAGLIVVLPILTWR